MTTSPSDQGSSANVLQGNGNMYVILVGCGRVGAELALTLSAEGHAVVIIDTNADSFNRLTDGFMIRVCAIKSARFITKDDILGLVLCWKLKCGPNI